MEQELRQMFEKKGAEMSVSPRLSHELRNRIGRQRMVMGGLVAAAAFALVLGGFAGARSLSSDEPVPPADPNPKESVFVDTWVNTDLDGSTQTMVVRASGEDAYEIVVRDDSATVCSGAPSTMTGTGRLDGARELVIPSPVFTCDDGSEPKVESGLPLEEQLRNLTFVHDPDADILTDNSGLVWDRGETTHASGGMWPQSSLEEVQRAQRLADEGDPRYTWQVFSDWPPYPNMEPSEADIFARFLQEKLGWEEFSWGVGPGLYPPEDWPWQFVVVRCAPGRTNPLYPNDPDGRECAPTLDENRYETVMINADQPVRDSIGEVRASGIWVVTRWQMLQPSDPPITGIDDFFQHQVQQVPPPSDAEATEFLSAFLQARVDGEGAEEFLQAPPEGQIPLLYATTSDAPYEGFEFDLAQGPEWPSGWMEFEVRLFAEDGRTVVEQPFLLDRGPDGHLLLVYRALEELDVTTTENGEAVAEPFEFLDGEMTLYATDRWTESFFYWGLGLDDDFDLRVEFAGNPRPVQTGCRPGRAPVDVESLARSIRSDPDLAATAPEPVTLGGIDGLRMDLTAAPGASPCKEYQLPEVLGKDDYWSALAPKQGTRIRLYLLDLPEGSSAQIMALAIIAPEDRLESLLEAAEPVVESVEFRSP
jgi:hypothetical protein